MEKGFMFRTDNPDIPNDKYYDYGQLKNKSNYFE